MISPGCTNCYAMKLAGTRMKHHPSRQGLTQPSKAGPVWNGQVRLNEEWLTQPLGWTRPRRIFVCAHGDLFHEAVPDTWIDRVFAVMALAPQHQFQVLTKRAERMRDYLSSPDFRTRRALALRAMYHAGEPATRSDRFIRDPLPNVWLGVSVEDQARADERIPLLLDTPAAIRWISAEPLLGPVQIPDVIDRGAQGIWFDPLRPKGLGINWVVVGGESGKDARPMHPDWALQLRDQCAAAGVPFLFKQWGEWAPGVWEDLGDACHFEAQERGVRVPDMSNHEVWSRRVHWFAAAPDGPGAIRIGKTAAGRLLDGRLHDALPDANAVRARSTPNPQSETLS